MISAGLLHKAFPNRYGTPDALRVRVKLEARTGSAAAALFKDPKAAWLIRILSHGMSEHDIVHRLYGEELHTGEFRDAEGLIWDCEPVEDSADTDDSRTFVITASAQLFKTLSARQSFMADANMNSSLKKRLD